VIDEEELARLRAENERLKCELAVAQQLIAEQGQQISVLEQRIAQLEHGSDVQPPTFVKPNRPKAKDPKQPRRKRAKEHNHGRKRETPSRTLQHALERCPECSYQLQGTSVDYARQVIELPPPQPIEVIEHEVIKRYCPKCERWQSPRLDLAGQVFGQGRMGARLASLIAYLRNVLRLPIRRIRDYLEAVHELTISIGEVVELLHQVREAKVTVEAVESLKGEAQASSILHADETGWREAGRNGYIWSFSTPGEVGVRYYEYDASRSHRVVQRILGAKFKGHLVSDFYGAYNEYAGKHQRCWIHLLRDLHELKEKHAGEAAVVEWAKEVRQLYDEAKEWLKTTTRAPTQAEREVRYVDLVGRSHQLGLRYARTKEHPCWALAKRLLRHEDELFQFVLVVGLSADNNLAERSVRPLVVVRKISGGSRSAEGTKTRMALASLFETWRARGLNPFAECFRLLAQPAPSPSLRLLYP
jgi:transposase